MPATYTHHTFSEDVYKVINVDIQDKLKDSKEIYNLFGKSFDVLFFVKPDLGHFAHKNNINLYFSNIIKYIKDNNLVNDGEALAYLYGSICHYVLDSTVHPYIFYKTGVYNKKNRKTLKYKGMHAYYEYMIDAILYNDRNRKSIARADLTKVLFPKLNFSLNLRKTIDYTYTQTFCTINMSKVILKGYKNFKFIVKHGMQSRLGIKMFFYKIANKLFNSKLENYCYYIKKLDKSVLNLEHKKWYYPVDKTKNFHYSFYDLYDLSIEKARVLINEINDALNDKISISKVLKDIGNNSYTTGKNASHDYKKRIYEY